MELKGRIIQVMPLQSGIGQVSGKEWKKQEYILETQEQYPRKVCFQLSGNRIEQYPLSVGEEVIVRFDLESRESKGRWYTDVRAWKVEKAQPAAPAAGGDIVPPPPVDFAPDDSTSDMPF